VTPELANLSEDVRVLVVIRDVCGEEPGVVSGNGLEESLASFTSSAYAGHFPSACG
jgi:hypothetical protein